MAGNPNTSGFVNWSRYFNANQSEAEQSAEKARAEAEKKAQAAQGSRSALQQEFRDKAGIQPQKTLATNTGTGAAGGGMSTNVGTGAMRTQVTAPAPAPVQDMSVDGLRASAKESQYGGPDGLAQLDGYGNALAQETDALGRVTALNDADSRSVLLQDAGATAGEGKLGSALQGQAGGEGFRGLKDYFRGDTLSEANDASVLEADAAKLRAADKRTALNAQADAEEDRLAAEKDAAQQEEMRFLAGDVEAGNAQRKYVEDRKKKKSFDQYIDRGHEGVVRDAMKALNPVDWIANAAGVRAPTDAIVDGIENSARGIGVERSSGGYHFNNTPADRAVYASMTPAELAALEKMGPQDARAWVMLRGRQLGVGG